MENKEKYLKILEKHSISEDKYKDVNRAICYADMLFGENSQKLNYDAFLEEKLPRVQMLRVWVDTLLICIGEGGHSLTCPTSDKVAHLAGHNLVSNEYLDEVECERILDALYKTGGSSLRAVADHCERILMGIIGEEYNHGVVSLPEELRGMKSGMYRYVDTEFTEDDIIKSFICAECESIVHEIQKSLRKNRVILYSQLNGMKELLNGSSIYVTSEFNDISDKVSLDFLGILFNTGVDLRGEDRLYACYTSLLVFRNYILSRELFPEYLSIEFVDGNLVIGGRSK